MSKVKLKLFIRAKNWKKKILKTTNMFQQSTISTLCSKNIKYMLC